MVGGAHAGVPWALGDSSGMKGRELDLTSGATDEGELRESTDGF